MFGIYLKSVQDIEREVIHILGVTARQQCRTPNVPWKVCAATALNDSLEDALRRAGERREKIAATVRRGSFSGSYGYGDRPIREEIVQEIRDDTGLAAAITRNSYGSLVLNTSRVMFVDVDTAYSTKLGNTVRGFWNSLLRKSSPIQAQSDAQLKRIEEVGRSRPALGYRLYRTAGGFRLLVTSDTYDPMTKASNELLAAFGSDRLYTRLCQNQECFRARLRPSSGGVGPRPPSRFPWATAEDGRNIGSGKRTTTARPTNSPHASSSEATALQA